MMRRKGLSHLASESLKINTGKEPEETERQYIWRICAAKDHGLLDASWEETAQIINAGLGKEEDEYLCESAYRKSYQIARDYYADVFSKETSASRQEEYRTQQETLYKLKTQVRDQRREYNKDLAREARAEHLHETIRECVNGLAALPPLTVPDYYSSDDGTEAVLFLSDWHYGLVTDNVWNKYSPKITRLRVGETVAATIEILQRHKVNTLHVVLLGDMVAGAIHTSVRVEAEEKVCEQLIHVSELLAEALASLSDFAPQIEVYCTYGNHARTIQNARDSVHGDNMERIIPWWLKERLRDFVNIRIVPEEECAYGELLNIPVGDWHLAAAHGDLDKPSTAGVTLSTMFQRKFGVPIDYVALGHWHHAESVDILGIDTTVVPALCGTDGYAHSRRLYSHPGQTVMVFTPEIGRECVYTIRFSI